MLFLKSYGLGEQVSFGKALFLAFVSLFMVICCRLSLDCGLTADRPTFLLYCHFFKLLKYIVKLCFVAIWFFLIETDCSLFLEIITSHCISLWALAGTNAISSVSF